LAGGELLAGRYAIERELGRGALGRVLLARDRLDADAPRAIKLVSAEHEARLRWEFGLLSQLGHPNLARVHELLRVERAQPELEIAAGSVALVSELAPGRPAGELAAELQQQRDPAALVAFALRVGDGVARALGALHAQGLVHGDVKPDNVVVDVERASCKLIDLGLAGTAAARGAPNGTLGYIAPEAWRGERGPASDMYALGVTLHAILRGAPAFDAGSLSGAELLSRALRPPSARGALPPSTPPALSRVIEALLEPDPNARLQRAPSLRARIAAIAHAQGVALLGDIGGGADDAPSPAERAAAVAALPLTGHAQALRALTAAVAQGGAVAVTGAPGSGRSRVVREAVREVQLARVQAGARVPTYRAVARLSSDPIEVDTVLHVAEGDGVDAEQVTALLASAAVEGCALSLVLERSAPLAGVAEVALSPLGEGEVRRLLEHALPGARVGSPLVREALAVSAGLSGRLCRVVAHGLALGLDMSRAPSLRALGAALQEGAPQLPAAARELADLLIVAGGELGPSAAQAALGSAAALSEGRRGLLAAGLAIQDGERLALRADWLHRARAAIDAPRLLALAARLPESELDGRARAHVALARGERPRAYSAFAAEIARLRAEGRAEQAAQYAREALLALSELDSGDALACALGDALRAEGRYAEASAAMDAATSAPALALRAEIARLCGDRERAHALAVRALARDGDGARAACEAEAVLARVAYDAGEIDRALELAEAALARRDEAAPAAVLRALEVSALARMYRGEREAARDTLAGALELAQKAHARAAQARLTSLFAQVARGDGDVHAAARHFVAAFELADGAGEQHAAAAFLHNVGVQRLDLGEPGPAIAALREAARRLARRGRKAELARALYNLGHAAQLIGDDDTAQASAERACEAAQAAGDAATEQYARCSQAELGLKRGDRKQVAALLSSAPDAGALASDAAASVLSRRAALHLGLGERAAALARLSEAEAAAREAGSDAAAVEPAIARGQYELEHGDAAAARAATEHAYALAQRAGSLDTRLRATLLSARAARAGGDAAGASARFSEVRTLLDHAARSLSPEERARLRAVDAYRAAFEALPSAAPAGQAAAHDDRWRALAGIVKRLTAERRLPRLYEIVLDAAIELSGAERGYLVLRDRDGRPRVRAARGIERKDARDLEQAPSRSIVARVLGSGRALTTMDAATDDQLSGAASIHALSLRSVMAVPLRIRGEVVGAIDLEDRLRPFAFGDVELALVSDLADLASIALDSAQLLRAERRDARRLLALRRRLSREVEAQALELASLKRAQHGEQGDFPGIIAHSRGMQRVLGSLGKIARSDVPVLIRGESGTGKELIAHAIHEAGARKHAPFVSENCGAIPETLLESALFGHVRGAFTGADRRKLGLFEAADGGTLFLDEIAEMSPSMQTRLLRVLQDGEVRPVGGERSRHVDVRLLCATHRDLEARVKDGSFREDLYYRIAVVTLALPPLRERAEDISPLCAHFIDAHAQGRKVVFDPRALAALARYSWPGNVRQLENEIRRALVMAEDRIELAHLSPELTLDAPGAAVDPLDLRAQVDQLERRLIRQALSAAAGNHTRAARSLGVSRYGLQKMIRRLDLGDEPAN
jgi:transcriptional regulator with GAF, ATPase, and Fis domain